MFILIITALFFSGTITETLRTYYPDKGNMVFKVNIFLLLSALLYMLSCTGIVIIKFFDRKWGHLLFSFSATIILVLDVFFFHFDWFRFLINVIFIILMSIVYISMHIQERKRSRKVAQAGSKL
jgi:hypothetical protein